MANQEFHLRLGAIADPIKKQIEEQGLKIDESSAESYDRARDAILILRFQDLLTDSQVDSIYKKLFKRIEKRVCQVNKLQKVKP